MPSTLYSTSPFVRSGGSREKLGPCASVLIYEVSKLVWNMGWILHWWGSLSWHATGDMIFVILKGLCCCRASFIVP